MHHLSHNGINGHIEPVYRGMGGLRQLNNSVENDKNGYLLLDAGGFLNANDGFAHQKATITMMNRARYTAAAISGLDLSDNGEQLQRLGMQFPLINCNHQFPPLLKGIIKPYHIIKAGAITVGITAVTRPVKGAVYKNAIVCANRTARFLKETEGCHIVICLSDLGLSEQPGLPGDRTLAEVSEDIDMIIGSDQGSLLHNNMLFSNKVKREVVFSTAIEGALTAGKTVFSFSNDRQKKAVDIDHVFPGQSTSQSMAACFREVREIKALKIC